MLGEIVVIEMITEKMTQHTDVVALRCINIMVPNISLGIWERFRLPIKVARQRSFYRIEASLK